MEGRRFFAEHWGIVVIYSAYRGWQNLDKKCPFFNVGTANQLEMLTLLFTADVYGSYAHGMATRLFYGVNNTS